MPFYDTALNRMIDSEAAAATWVSAHTADPTSAGLNQHGSRVQTTWGAPTSGDRTGSQVGITIAAGVTITHWALWTAATGGTCEGAWPLSASESFPNGGTLNHTPTVAVDPG